MTPFHRLATAALLLLAGTCSATPPLMDLLEYEGQRNIVSPRGRPWLDLLENEKTQEIRRQARCSAIGEPRARWRVSDGRLWLVALYGCRGDFKLESVYGGSGEPMFADWITADLITQRGKTLCSPQYGGAGILETTIVIQVVRGVVTRTIKASNDNHPAIPTVEKLRKLLGPKDAHHAEELVTDWSCFDALTLRELQGTPAVETAPTGSSYVDHLYDHARRLLGK